MEDDGWDVDNTESAAVKRDNESFLNRWSKRKLRAQDRAPDIKPTPEAPKQVPAKTDDTDRQELADADMPPLESLNERSDYSGFFSPKVSAELRRRALRKLFHSSVFNITDGLDDYDDDFTTFAPLGDVVTHDMRRMMALESERAQQQPAPAESGVVADDNAELKPAPPIDPAVTTDSRSRTEHKTKLLPARQEEHEDLQG